MRKKEKGDERGRGRDGEMERRRAGERVGFFRMKRESKP